MDATQFKIFAKSLLKDSSLADFEIKCDQDSYQVHRVILACHSRYFKALFAGEYSESSKRCIVLQDDDPNAVKLMIDYFYGFDYEDAHDKITGFSNPLELNAAIYTIADKYDVPDLKKLAVKHFARAAPHSAFREESPVEAIRMIYTGTPSTDRHLRDLAIQYWMSFSGAFSGGQGAKIATGLAHEVPEFAAETLLLHIKPWADRFEATCVPQIGDRAYMSVKTVHEVFHQKCPNCRKFMSEHTSLKATRHSHSWSPFWLKALE
ncbi:hypothetical protein PRZ48_003456 [Zasmidium cellare]|uniref:BTB domain-containing protein n=1 Tax=Zasmidium cellare TaxID=395010 RepID=A0ABR0EXB3_ZASCE|nr:hypothetical protein PRZ48_003456 [Zasmidium cellare]